MRDFNFVFMPLAALVVYPDKVLEAAGWRFGRVFELKHAILLEFAALAAMLATVALAKPFYPRLSWWQPFLTVGAVGLVRGISWLVAEILGFHREDE